MATAETPIIEPKSEKEQNRQRILELGRRLAREIESFSHEQKSDISLEIVFGAIDYLIAFHKNRRAVASESFTNLRKMIENAGLKDRVVEPYTSTTAKPPRDIIEELNQQADDRHS